MGMKKIRGIEFREKKKKRRSLFHVLYAKLKININKKVKILRTQALTVVVLTLKLTKDDVVSSNCRLETMISFKEKKKKKQCNHIISSQFQSTKIDNI